MLVLLRMPLPRTKKAAGSREPTSVRLLRTMKRISKLRRKLASRGWRSRLSYKLLSKMALSRATRISITS